MKSHDGIEDLDLVVPEDLLKGTGVPFLLRSHWVEFLSLKAKRDFSYQGEPGTHPEPLIRLVAKSWSLLAISLSPAQPGLPRVGGKG
jgi:hypothetical protein